MQITPTQIRSDATDPLLDIRLHGDLTLLAEQLRGDATLTLVDAMADLAQICSNEVRALSVVDDCRELLGATN